MTRPWALRRAAVTVAALAALGPAAGCSATSPPAVHCRADQRLAIVAQSVPGAAYVPCVAELPPGWEFRSFDVHDGSTRFSLRSDRADHPVRVRLQPACDVEGSTPAPPRDEGVRTYQRVSAISPRYAGRIYDVFSGGCVEYEFDFERGPHIALVDDMNQAVRLYPRRLLRQQLEDDLGITLDH